MPAKKHLKAPDPLKETCRLIRLARSYWDAHNNLACRTHRDKALTLYGNLTPEQRQQIPQELLVWLRYRSEKYFGPQRTAPGTHRSRHTANEAE
jgi:hypothetical protein